VSHPSIQAKCRSNGSVARATRLYKRPDLGLRRRHHCRWSTKLRPERDLGQAENPIHPMGLKVFITQLTVAGVTRDEVDVMVRRNPARMLDLT
jgi:predicted metal-dependent phosphotriesterase family hydrolase